MESHMTHEDAENFGEIALTQDQWTMLRFLHNPMQIPEGGPVMSLTLRPPFPVPTTRISSIISNSLSRHIPQGRIEGIYRSLAEMGLIENQWDDGKILGSLPIMGRQTTDYGRSVLESRRCRMKINRQSVHMRRSPDPSIEEWTEVETDAGILIVKCIDGEYSAEPYQEREDRPCSYPHQRNGHGIKIHEQEVFLPKDGSEKFGAFDMGPYSVEVRIPV